MNPIVLREKIFALSVTILPIDPPSLLPPDTEGRMSKVQYIIMHGISYS